MATRKTSSPSRALHTYLIAYNVISLACWSVILVKTLSLLFTRQPFPNTLSGLIAHLSHGYDYKHLGTWVIWTQTGALLEVAHAALGWVRSSPVTVAMQVASRIWLVWGVLARQPETHSHPLFVTMVLAWSVTECIRYSFYACNLLGLEPALLNWLRYNTFYILYPLGAGSEAFLMFSTLPKFGDWANWQLGDYWTLALFVIWWPGAFGVEVYRMGIWSLTHVPLVFASTLCALHAHDQAPQTSLWQGQEGQEGVKASRRGKRGAHAKKKKWS